MQTSKNRGPVLALEADDSTATHSLQWRSPDTASSNKIVAIFIRSRRGAKEKEEKAPKWKTTSCVDTKCEKRKFVDANLWPQI